MFFKFIFYVVGVVMGDEGDMFWRRIEMILIKLYEHYFDTRSVVDCSNDVTLMLFGTR